MNQPVTWHRALICLLAAVTLWLATGGWSPPFPYRERLAPTRNLHARVDFRYDDPEATIRARQRARRNVLTYYQNDQRAIEELREALIDRVFQIQSKPEDQVDRSVWNEFTDAGKGLGLQDPPDSLEKFREALSGDESLEALQAAVETAMSEIERNGLLENVQHELGEGSVQEILVYPLNNPQNARRVDVSTVRIAEVKNRLRRRLREELQKVEDQIGDPQRVADHIYMWMAPRLEPTLVLDKVQTERAIEEAEEGVEPVQREFLEGDVLERPDWVESKVTAIEAGQPLSREDILLLKAEHREYVDQMSLLDHLVYSLAHLGMYAGMFLLLSAYLYYREQSLVEDWWHFILLVGLLWVTVVACWLVSWDKGWRSEMIPVVMFAMTVAIAFNRELAFLLSGIVSLIFTVSHGYGVAEFVILMAAAATASLLCGRIRSRTRLVYVGLIGGAVAFPTTIGIYVMTGQPLSSALLLDAVWFAGGSVLAGLSMTAILPFLENWFEIETDISLLELSDANHPLLRQLVQRAPGTYNHSINVASIAEAAADAISANGLLCRVGAYFHDIGKMRKPEYFIENQIPGHNKHDDLVPTMSTLVIIAHVKDGAEMARKHHLPDRIIELIEQHHGTTLVEYFYQQATANKENGEEPAQVDEKDFRYPGPKPQSPEAAVLMLADAVESASRALREPTPSRIEHLVKGLLKKKLEDGQFDECAVTLKQLHTVQDKLIKSLNAMYHARVKYPGPQPA